MTNLHHDQPHVPSHDDSHAERSTLAPRSYVVSTTDSILVPDQTVAGCAGEYHSASSHPTSAASSASSDTASARTQHSAPIDPLADLWKEAIERYEHNTGVKLIPSRDVSFDSTNAVLGYIQHHEADFKKYRADGPQKLRSIIKPIAATVQTLCGVVGEAVSMVCSPAEAIFTALNVVIQASRQVTDDFDAVADAFDTMEHHLRMVGSIATAGDMHEAVREASVKLLAQLLVVLGTVTNLQKHNRLQLWWKKVQQSKKVSSALDELGRLATNHHQTVSVVTLSSVVNAVDMLVESRDWDKRGRDESQARHEQLTSLLEHHTAAITELQSTLFSMAGGNRATGADYADEDCRRRKHPNQTPHYHPFYAPDTVYRPVALSRRASLCPDAQLSTVRRRRSTVDSPRGSLCLSTDSNNGTYPRMTTLHDGPFWFGSRDLPLVRLFDDNHGMYSDMTADLWRYHQETRRRPGAVA